MYVKRSVGEKGQVVLPKDMREFVGIKPGSAVVFEVRGKEIVIAPETNPKGFVEDLCSVPKKVALSSKKLRELREEQYALP